MTGSEIISQLRSINSSSFASDVEREQAIEEAHALVSRLETPYETSSRLCLSFPATLICVQIGLDLGLFQSWLSKNDGKPCTSKELHELVPQCDHNLFMRLLRHLVSSNVLWIHHGEQGDLLYEMTPYIYGQVKNDFASQLECTYLWALQMQMSLPKFLEKINYVNPQEAPLNPVKEYTGGLTMWEYLRANEGWTKVFSRLMSATASIRGDVIELLQSQQLNCEDQDSVLLVDVGGSEGRDLISFRQHFKEARGRLVLQDLPQVIESAPSLDEWTIEKMSYDFFTPQPVVGARAYLLHNIIHDWPDNDAKRILENVAAAMGKDNSRLLIMDQVIREESPTLRETSSDWLMMVYGNGMESEYRCRF